MNNVLDDVGRRIQISPISNDGYLDRVDVEVVMAIVAPNGDCCRIFAGSSQWDEYHATAVRVFMENHT